MSYENRREIVKKIRRARTIAIFMHNSPDGDCIGSAIALEEAIKNMGKNVDVIFQDKVNKKYTPIVGEKRVGKIIRPKEGKKYDLAILVDCADLSRTVNYIGKISKEFVIIDHHPVSSRPVCDVYCYEKTSATGIIVYKIIKQLTQFTSSIANALYLSIVSDTNFFRNVNTDQSSYEVSSRLLALGAQPALIVNILESKSKNFYILLGSVINNIKINKKHKILSLMITREQIKAVNATDSEAALVVDYLKEIEDIEIVYLFIEGISNVRIRARSKLVKVNDILSVFGGGGHNTAAGCAIENKSLIEVEEEVLNHTYQYLINTSSC